MILVHACFLFLHTTTLSHWSSIDVQKNQLNNSMILVHACFPITTFYIPPCPFTNTDAQQHYYSTTLIGTTQTPCSRRQFNRLRRQPGPRSLQFNLFLWSYGRIKKKFQPTIKIWYITARIIESTIHITKTSKINAILLFQHFLLRWSRIDVHFG